MKNSRKPVITMVSDRDRISLISTMINSGAISGQSICDLGSRNEELFESIKRKIEYLGVDIYPIKENSIYSDIEKKIETERKFDIVTALDVLEHTNDIAHALGELLRICRGTFVINLPNELTLLARLRLLSGRISGKFQINLDSLDRHRWFFTLANVENFIEQTDLRTCEIELIAFYREGGWLARINWLFGIMGFHSLGAHSFIIIGRKSEI